MRVKNDHRRLLLSYCLNWKIHCDDHSSLSLRCCRESNYYHMKTNISGFGALTLTLGKSQANVRTVWLILIRVPLLSPFTLW